MDHPIEKRLERYSQKWGLPMLMDDSCHLFSWLVVILVERSYVLKALDDH